MPSQVIAANHVKEPMLPLCRHFDRSLFVLSTLGLHPFLAATRGQMDNLECKVGLLQTDRRLFGSKDSLNWRKRALCLAEILLNSL